VTFASPSPSPVSLSINTEQQKLKSEKKGMKKHRNAGVALPEGAAADGGGSDPRLAWGSGHLRIVLINWVVLHLQQRGQTGRAAGLAEDPLTVYGNQQGPRGGGGGAKGLLDEGSPESLHSRSYCSLEFRDQRTIAFLRIYLSIYLYKLKQRKKNEKQNKTV
jgi:hypothetical protein